MRHLLRVTATGTGADITFTHSALCGSHERPMCLCTDVRMVDCEECFEKLRGNK